MPLSLVIFDFDGVLADSEGIALEELAAEITARGAPVSVDEAHGLFLGASTARHMAYIRDRTGQPCGADFPDAWHARLFRRYPDELRPVPGAEATLDALAQAGVAICIASGGAVARLEVALRCTGLAARFAQNVFSADMVAQGKPAPDLFLYAAAKMGVPPGDCVVIEDAPAGMQAARAAGMPAIAFTGGCHLIGKATDHAALLSAAGAEAVAPDHAALRALLSARLAAP